MSYRQRLILVFFLLSSSSVCAEYQIPDKAWTAQALIAADFYLTERAIQ